MEELGLFPKNIDTSTMVMFVNFGDNERVSVAFKQVTPNFTIPKPKEWNLEDPYSLIYPYYYAFHQLSQIILVDYN